MMIYRSLSVTALTIILNKHQYSVMYMFKEPFQLQFNKANALYSDKTIHGNSRQAK